MSAIYKSDAGRRRVEETYRSFLNRWPVPSEFVTVPTREGDTFVVVCGPETAPPLVLLHGSMGNATTWMGEIAAYAAHFRCFCVDIIGEPGLSAPSRPDLKSEAYAFWLDDVLAGLGLGPVSILALSLGGLVAFDYAARRPGQVVALAGISPAGICHSKNFILNYLPYFFLGAWGRQKIYEAIMGKALAASSPEAREFRQFCELISDQFRPRMETLSVLTNTQIKSLDFPILVIVGGQDVMLKTGETRDRLQAFAPHAEIDYRPSARHYIPGTPASIVPFLLDANGLEA